MIIYFVVGAVILVVIALAFLMRGYQRIEILKQQTLAQAIPAEAEIVAIERGDFNRERGNIRELSVRLTLNVQHPMRPAYRVETIWLVDELLIPQIQPQKIVPVLINAIDPERIYPNQRGMEFADWKLKKI